MVYKYKGNNIDINDTLVKQYKYCVGMDLEEPEIDHYVQNYLIKNSENKVKEEGLTEQELKEWIEHSMKIEIRIRENP